MAQEWNMRHVLIDKQGNFGSIAGLPAAAMRYTEARMSPFAAMMLDDLKLDTVDFVPTTTNATRADGAAVKFPNLLVNGSGGIAVGMATSIPAAQPRAKSATAHRVIDNPDVSIDELMEHHPRPRLPDRRHHLRPHRHSPRLHDRPQHDRRPRSHHDRGAARAARIIIHEIPYQQPATR
jgi:DNA gyrase subunit A